MTIELPFFREWPPAPRARSMLLQRLEKLECLRQKLVAITDRFAGFKIHDIRMMRLMAAHN